MPRIPCPPRALARRFGLRDGLRQSRAAGGSWGRSPGTAPGSRPPRACTWPGAASSRRSPRGGRRTRARPRRRTLATPSTMTRHPPHMPVPSTMIVFKLTRVDTPYGSVVFEQNFIISGGPMAIARWTSLPFARRLSIKSFSTSVTKPLRPYEPSSVQTRSSFEAAPRRSSKTSRSFLRAPRIVTTSCPASRKARAIGSMGAAPMPPATQATVPRKSSGLPGTAMCVGLPRGPATFENASPSPKASVISIVVFPTACTTRVIVPLSRSASAIVSGIRSERACGRTMTNWPARWRLATRGASTSKRVTFSPSDFLTRISNTRPPSRNGRETRTAPTCMLAVRGHRAQMQLHQIGLNGIDRRDV